MADASHEPEEHHLSVARTARFWTAGNVRTGAELWVVCHGYAQLAGRFIRRFNAIAGDERGIVAPEGLNRFYLDARPGPHGPDSPVGATWMTREDRLSEINDYVAYLDALCVHVQRLLDRPPSDVRVLGFSQGAATASRWVAMGRSRIDRLFLWGGFLPPDLDLPQAAPALRAARLTVVLGSGDAHATAERRTELETRMAAHDLRGEVIEYEGGHRMHADTLRMIAAR